MNAEERKYRSLITERRRWLLLPTLDRYIFREFMIKLCVLMLVFTIIFVLGDVFDALDDFLDAEAPMADFVTFLLLKFPGNMRFVLPVALLLGCMWTMAYFGKNMEVTAMRASGLSLYRCGMSIIVVGLVFTAGDIYFNELLVPYTEREAQTLRDSIDAKPDKFSGLLTYRSPDRRRSWFFNRFDTDSDNAGVLLKMFGPDGRLQWELTAESAEYRKGHGWVFHNVRQAPYSRDGLMPLHTLRYDTFELPAEEAPETPMDIFNASARNVDDLPSWTILGLLRRNPDMPPAMSAVYWSVFYYRIAFPWSCLLAVLLGIPLATRNERSGSILAMITAVAVIVVYVFVSQMFLLFGKQGVVPPLLAGLLPTVCFMGYGYYRVFHNRL